MPAKERYISRQLHSPTITRYIILIVCMGFSVVSYLFTGTGLVFDDSLNTVEPVLSRMNDDDGEEKNPTSSDGKKKIETYMVVGLIAERRTDFKKIEDHWNYAISMCADCSVEFVMFDCDHTLESFRVNGSRVTLPSCGDGYEDLTSKTREIRKYVADHYKYQYYVKVDEDIFFNFEEVYRRMEGFASWEQNSPNDVYASYRFQNGRMRDDGKHADIAYGQRTGGLERSVTYAKGPLYILGPNNVDFLNHLAAIPQGIFPFANEDMAVGVMLNLKEKVEYYNFMQQSKKNDVKYFKNGTEKLPLCHHASKLWDQVMKETGSARAEKFIYILKAIKKKAIDPDSKSCADGI